MHLRELFAGGGDDTESTAGSDALFPGQKLYRQNDSTRIGYDGRLNRENTMQADPWALRKTRRPHPMTFPPFVPPGQGSPGATGGGGEEQLLQALQQLLGGMQRQ